MRQGKTVSEIVEIGRYFSEQYARFHFMLMDCNPKGGLKFANRLSK